MDGTVEAIEPADTAAPALALGVQWHPELFWNDGPHDTTGPAVFTWLVRLAENGSTRSLTPT